MNDNYKFFCDRVCSYIDHATDSEKRAIHKELSDHIEDHAQALMDLGRSEEEARIAAIVAMGDPEEIGREMNKEYPFMWLIVSRIPAVIAGILILCMLLSPFYLSFYYACLNIQARTFPQSGEGRLNGHNVENIIDIRTEIPSSNDIIRFFAADIVETTEGYYAYISSCCYDKWIFGESSSYLHGCVEYYSGEESPLLGHSAGGSSNYGVSYWTNEIPVDFGQKAVTASFDRFGNSWSLEIPLNWEGIS